jgi:hypothetical protein
MSRLTDVLPSDVELPPTVRTNADRYADQGGLLGTFTYCFAYLGTDDADLAARLASIPTDLFVASALHDDAIDEADDWTGARKRRLNEHVSVGDLAFANVLEAAAEAPADVDLTPALEVVREIGAGQLAEEGFDATATVDDAVARVEERGGVWGDLAVELVGAAGGYSDAQRRRLRTIATNGLFVLTVVDDLADLHEDAANDVVTLPLVCFDGDPDDYRSTEALVDAVLASDVPGRLETLVDRRRAEIDLAASELYGSLERSDGALLAAADRALRWYRESVCSVPVAETVPPERQRAIRDRLTGSDRSRRRYVADRVDDLPVAVDTDAAAAAVADLPGDRLARTAIRCRHCRTLAESMLYTTLEEALAALRAESASPTG